MMKATPKIAPGSVPSVNGPNRGNVPSWSVRGSRRPATRAVMNTSGPNKPLEMTKLDSGMRRG